MPAGRDVRRHHHRDRLAAERLHRPRPLARAAVAVQLRDAVPGVVQRPGQLLRAVLGPREHQHRRHLPLFEQVLQQGRLAVRRAPGRPSA